MLTLVLDAPGAGAARLRLAGHLDSQGARDVLHAAADVASSGCSRLVVDLADLVSYDDDAAYALTGCVQLGRWLAGGVTVVAGSAAGWRLADTAGVVPHPAQGHATGTMVPCPAC